MFVIGVNYTGKKDKNFEIKFFYYFVESLVQCTLHLKVQASYYWQDSLFTGLVDTAEKFIGGVVYSVDKFQAFWLFMTGDNDTGDKLVTGVIDTGAKFVAGINDIGNH